MEDERDQVPFVKSYEERLFPGHRFISIFMELQKRWRRTMKRDEEVVPLPNKWASGSGNGKVVED